MVSYRIGVIESYGFSVQKSFLNFVNDMKPGYLLENLDFILHTIRPIASFECEDWSMTDTDTVTFRHGCLPPTAALAELRKQYFQLTKNLFQLVTTNANRRKVFDAMFCLADVPHSDLSIETVDLLSTDIANIIDFLIASIDNLSNVNKEDVQKLVYRIERLPFKNQFTNLTILNDRIAHDPFFEKFRIFYGDDLHFFPNFDFKKAKSFRLSKIDEYVNVIDCGNFDDWRPLFEELLSSHKEFGGLLGGLMYFQIFLRKLGEQKPAVAFKFLNSVDLGPFLGAILSGLMESSAKEEARERLTSNSKRIETQLATAQVLLTKKD